MSYSIDKSLDSEGSSMKWMEAGIHEDVKLEAVEYRVSEKGNEFMTFNFVNSFGEKLSYTEWPVRPVKPVEQMTEDEKKNHENKGTNQLKRVRHIIIKFFKPEELEGKQFPFILNPRKNLKLKRIPLKVSQKL